MRVQRLKNERDRIRNEEVVPLNDQLRQLEEQQTELASRLAGLQSEEEGVEGRDAMLEEFPLPPLSLGGLSSSRTSTLRERNRSRGFGDA
jgi:hypothetical protein